MEPADEKRGRVAFGLDLRKSQSKIVVYNFTISQVCDFVFESFGALHETPCFAVVFNKKAKVQGFCCSLLERNWMNEVEVV